MSQPDSPSFPSLLLAAPAAGLLAIIIGAVCVALAFGGSAAGCGTGAGSETGKFKGIPPELVPLYQEAAAGYHLGPKGPSILASINFNESSFGTNMGDPPGAYGWMSFLPESWSAFGVDGNGDGTKDAYDPEDAIPAAAGLLAHLGAPGNWHNAIYGYNHAEWYVDDVLADAAKWSAIDSIEAVASCGVSAPTEAVAAMIAEANRLSARRPFTDYVWGGSHGLTPTPPDGPFDCSSAVSHELQVGGFKNPTMDTIALAGWGEPGPGKWVTILVKAYEPEAHTVLKFMPGVTPPSKRYWGTSGMWFSGHGPGWIPESVFDAGYLSRFQERHPPGL